MGAAGLMGFSVDLAICIKNRNWYLGGLYLIAFAHTVLLPSGNSAQHSPSHPKLFNGALYIPSISMLSGPHAFYVQ